MPPARYTPPVAHTVTASTPAAVPSRLQNISSVWWHTGSATFIARAEISRGVIDFRRATPDLADRLIQIDEPGSAQHGFPRRRNRSAASGARALRVRADPTPRGSRGRLPTAARANALRRVPRMPMPSPVPGPITAFVPVAVEVPGRASSAPSAGSNGSAWPTAMKSLITSAALAPQRRRDFARVADDVGRSSAFRARR